MTRTEPKAIITGFDTAGNPIWTTELRTRERDDKAGWNETPATSKPETRKAA